MTDTTVVEAVLFILTDKALPLQKKMYGSIRCEMPKLDNH